MSQLHLISQSPYKNRVIDDTLRTLQPNDTVLLINDGTYLVTATETLQQITDKGAKVVALDTDIKARGLAANGIEIIDMKSFVKMSFDAQHIISWL